MAATQEDDGVAAVKNKLVAATDGAHRLQALLDSASVRVAHIHRETNVAFVTMPIVLTEATSNATEAAFVAVIDRLVRVVGPQLANVAVIARGFGHAVRAIFGRLLNGLTHHADHRLSFKSVDLV